MPASFAPCSPLQRDEVVVGDDLGADEALLEVGVDLARRLRRHRADVRRPGAHFLRAGGEERQQPEQVVGGADHAVEARLVQPELLEERRRSPSSSCAISASIAAHTGTTSAPSCVRALLRPRRDTDCP